MLGDFINLGSGMYVAAGIFFLFGLLLLFVCRLASISSIPKWRILCIKAEFATTCLLVVALVIEQHVGNPLIKQISVILRYACFSTCFLT